MNLLEPQNVGSLLTQSSIENPNGIAVAHDSGKGLKDPSDPLSRYDTITFDSLEVLSNQIAAGLQEMGIKKGTRIALLVPPSVNFVACVFGLFKSGATMILIDPGMGRKNMIRCLAEARPEGFVAIPLAQAIRVVLRHKFPHAKKNLTIGSRWFWGGKTLKQFQQMDAKGFKPSTQHDDEAAMIFTTGSTGPPKGVLYHHRNFIKQVQQIKEHYNIKTGGADLSAFPLFALFNAGMGKTTIIPDMDATKPAKADPQKIIRACADWKADQSFGSPALWNTVSRFCEQHEVVIPTLKKVFSAGAPVPVHVLNRVKKSIHPEGEIYTPYGATESLPVASISATTVLSETKSRTENGAGTCVGSRFSGIDWKVIAIDDDPLADISQTKELPAGEIGELMVRGEVVTREYVTRTEANALHKVTDGETFWHRMGDVGYIDDQQRFWFCGRKAHRVVTKQGALFTIQCEAIFNQHEDIYRSALVGYGSPGQSEPVMIVEPWPEHFPATDEAKQALISELLELGSQNEKTTSIKRVLIHPSFPVDIRHNAKIFREKLTVWAQQKIGDSK